MATRLAAIARLLPSPAGTALSWGLAPHAPYSLSDGAAARVATFARRHDLRVAMHLAETAAEVEFLEQGRGSILDRLFPAAGWSPPQRSGAGPRPVAWARQQDLLMAGSMVVHGVHVDAAGIDLIAANRCSVALCPRSNSAFGETRAPLKAYRQAGVNIALGTDSLASAPSLSIWEELAFARQWYQGILAPEQWLEIATLGGARALGAAKEMGSLEPGKEASFQVVAAPDCSGPEELSEALCTLGESVQIREHYIAGARVASAI
ncbi:MAG TPA: amidohydrolase family protein [Desulfuromonadales bacterium]|nr:amidohydrolase family protein [Desulfuromonadales bacterium]